MDYKHTKTQQLTNAPTHQLKISSTHQLKKINPRTQKTSTHKLKNINPRTQKTSTHKLKTHQPQKSQAHQPTNSKTQKLKLLFFILQQRSIFRTILAKIWGKK